jgi:hypothetical protein
MEILRDMASRFLGKLRLPSLGQLFDILERFFGHRFEFDHDRVDDLCHATSTDCSPPEGSALGTRGIFSRSFYQMSDALTTWEQHRGMV